MNLDEVTILYRRTLVSGAKELQQAADLICSSRSSPPKELPLELLVQTVHSELRILEDLLFNVFGKDIIRMVFIHSRLEYLLRILNFLIKNHFSRLVASADHIVDQIFIWFKLVYHQLSSLDHGSSEYSPHKQHHNIIEEELLSIPTTVPSLSILQKLKEDKEEDQNLQLTAQRMDWYRLCFSSLAFALHSIVRKAPQSSKALKLNLAEAITLVNSYLWQNQLVALTLINALLVMESLSLIRMNRTDSSIKIATEQPHPIPSSRSAKPVSNVESRGKRGSVVGSSSTPSLAKSSSTDDKKNLSKSRMNSDRIQPSNSTSGKSSSKMTDSVKNLVQIRTSEEICRTGLIRSLLLLSFHKETIIRWIANEICRLQLNITCAKRPLADAAATKEDDVSDIWSSSFEQGLIPLLEIISTGVKILGTDPLDCFPESNIRKTAKAFLSLIVQHAEKSAYIRQRVLTALTHSGNQKLRINIVVGIFYTCGRSRHLGKLFWDGGPPQSRAIASQSFPSGGQHYSTMCASLQQDALEFKQYLQVILHIIEVALLLLTEKEKMHSSGREISTQTAETRESASAVNSERGFAAAVRRIRETIIPTVLVRSDTSKLWTKMVCPSISFIRKYGESFADEIQRFGEVQIEEAILLFQQTNASPFESLDSLDSAMVERQLKAFMLSVPEECFLKLEGSYATWQEIFSHIADSFLRKTSIERLSLAQLLESLALATKFKLWPLVSSYETALVGRVQTNTLIPIFRAALQETHSAATNESPSLGLTIANKAAPATPQYAATMPKRVHTQLIRACLCFMLKDWDGGLVKKPPKELLDLLQCLCSVFGLLTV